MNSTVYFAGINCLLKQHTLIEKKQLFTKEENAILVGLVYKEQTETQVNEYLDELDFLAETAGAKTVKRFTQKLPHPFGTKSGRKNQNHQSKTYQQGF
mgnify:CR=1 FL=1